MASNIDLGDQRMHVMEAGDPSGRPVLMLHGNPTWGFLYRKVVDALEGAPRAAERTAAARAAASSRS